jgi:uncharacterized protein (TIGR02646 family)
MATNPMYNNKRWRAIRIQVLKRDDYTCAYCGRHANTVDHITPLAHDPTMAYDTSNLVAACTACNSGKRDRVGFFGANKHPRPPISLFTPDQTEQVESPFKRPDLG